MKQFAGMFCAAALWCAPLAAQAEIYGLIIGVDDYAYVPSLAGAVNDARDISATLEERGADVTLLLDREATRARIMQEYETILGKVQSGDTIVITFAGHGIQMPEALAGDEPDGKDETFILHGFNVRGEGLGERIRDNDISEMLSRVPLDVAVLMVADSCHSGTMTRSVDPRGDLGPMRFVDIGTEFGADPLAKPHVRTRSVEAGDLPNVVYAHAARDDQQTPEVQIDGVYRGALSWSVARALDGQADGGDGMTTLSDFQDFVIEQVRNLSGTRQTPGVTYSRAVELMGADGAGIALSVLLGNEPEAPPPPPAPEVDLALADPPGLYVKTADSTRAVFLGGARLVSTEETARLLWDRESRELVDRATADVIAEAEAEASVELAVKKWRAVQPLLRWSPRRPLQFRLEPDDRRFTLGDAIHITIARPGPGFDYLTIVNLASTGEVQFIFPAAGHTRTDQDRIDPGQTAKRLGPSPISPPTGADHVIALASQTRLTDLHNALERLHGTPAPEELLDLLGRHASDPEQVRVGLLPIFTQR
ncbi:MAG: caspase family protein [Pseudomonadota bacterium]